MDPAQDQPLSRLLWTSHPRQLLSTHTSGIAFHINRRQSTPLWRAAVGVVGNRGTVSPLPALFSKSPQIHTRDLENPPRGQPRGPQALPHISYFSSPPTGTTVFYLIHLLNIHSPSRIGISGWRRSLGLPFPAVRQPGHQTGPHLTQKPGNPENCPLFPPPRNPGDEYNQEEQTTAVSAGLKVL
jgi:hypothetical protein